MTCRMEVNGVLLDYQFLHGLTCLKRQLVLFASSEGLPPNYDLNSVASEQEELPPKSSEESSSYLQVERTGGKAGFISFYGHPYRKRAEPVLSGPSKGDSDLFLFIGPAVVVASLVFPSLYLRRILSTIFEDSLLTDHLQRQRPLQPVTSNSYSQLATGIGLRISSVATLVLSLIIPMVTMGFVWPWTGPAASATLAPYLVGIVVQFAFEKYARFRKSSAWPVIPVIFQVRTELFLVISVLCNQERDIDPAKGLFNSIMMCIARVFPVSNVPQRILAAVRNKQGLLGSPEVMRYIGA
ncbi:hypothetical protein ACLOJK_001921 [Asimina triloba]